MKYTRKIDFSQKDQNPITCMYYKKSKKKKKILWKTVLIIPVYRYSLLV